MEAQVNNCESCKIPINNPNKEYRCLFCWETFKYDQAGKDGGYIYCPKCGNISVENE